MYSVQETFHSEYCLIYIQKFWYDMLYMGFFKGIINMIKRREILLIIFLA